MLKTPEILQNRLIALKFTPPGKSPLIIVGLYVPASYSDTDKGVFLMTCLSEVNHLKNTYANVIVAGDFNMFLLRPACRLLYRMNIFLAGNGRML